MKKLIFISFLTMLILIGCEDNDDPTGLGNEGIELEWIYKSDPEREDYELYYTHDDQITIVDTSSYGYILYGIKEFYEELGQTYPNWREYELNKCDEIVLFIYGTQNPFFTYSYDILPEVVYTNNINLNNCVWKEK